MAASDAVWGVDIGQCALKALRCRVDPDDKTKLIADGYDFIEYPQNLGEPDVEPAELVRDAIKKFLSRNDVSDDQVAMSVSGQAGLSRFIKLPPVEAKKIPDIVRYEARQQIPFKLEDVVWDFQKMPGGSEEEGFALETEVGLFAMKRDQVYKALKPLEQLGIEVNFVQLTPLAIFNYVSYDQLGELPAEYDPENPPDSVVILSVGTDSTDLVVTNGFRVWQRSIPLGGNHFTKALTKQLKLTFGKAEHLKRNAGAAKPEDAKALFKAMKPVFSDLLTEVQTSLRYFSMNVDKRANISRIIGLGNAFKLPGMRRFLSQNLEIEVVEAKKFARLGGSEVTGAPSFKDNTLSFGVCYGLALQGLKKSTLQTNLLPKEINTERLIREKKPWALAAASLLLLGLTISYFGHWNAWRISDPGLYKRAKRAADNLVTTTNGYKNRYSEKETVFVKADASSARLAGTIEGPRLWIELIKAINEALPKNPEGFDPQKVSDRLDLRITELDGQWYPSKAYWYNSKVRALYEEAQKSMATASSEEPGDEGPAAGESAASEGGGPGSGDPGSGDLGSGDPGEENGPGGWVIQLSGLHYHNVGQEDIGARYVQKTLINNLITKTVQLPDQDGNLQDVPIKDLGISNPVLVDLSDLNDVPNPAKAFDPTAKPDRVKEFTFIVQFWWEQRPLSKRQVPAQQNSALASAAGGGGE